ncbi:acyltransferase [Lewinella sp. IMCC34183]|uniref:acyltransferase n=1 Tax=Lewinella sp. IMCC34183 TaxID=2248762 RepID=UPI0013005B52|nr:acyltransferase [Lewinella sp. IMCC34183]
MKEKLKHTLIQARNRWGASNSIRKDAKSKVTIGGNLLNTQVKVGGNSELTIPEGCRIRNATIEIRGNNNRVVLGEGVYMSGKIELVGDGNELIIGKDTRINGAELIIHNGTRVEIGEGSLFSTQIVLRTTDNHTIMNADGKRINPDEDIYIGKHVWICRMVTILKGSHVGDGTIVGAMSLVTGKIGENVIAAGVPAKTIRENMSWK